MYLKKGIAFETAAKLVIVIIVLTSIIMFIMWQLERTEKSIEPPMEATEKFSIVNSICYRIFFGDYIGACKIIENHTEIESKYCLSYGGNKIKCDFSTVSEGCCIICDKNDIANSGKC